MEIAVAQEQGKVPVTRFIISGPFNSDELLVEKAKAAYAEGARNVLIDLSAVEYMSSAGLRALHAIYMLLRDTTETGETVSQGLRSGSYHAAHIKLLKPSRLVKEVLKTTGYDMFIDSYNDLKAALNAFS